MKKTFKIFLFISSVLYTLSCKNNDIQTTTDEKNLTVVELSKDKDFNALISSINKFEQHIAAKTENLTKDEKLKNITKINQLLAKGNNLSEQDINEISNLFGYENSNLYLETLEEHKYLGDKLREKFTFLKEESSIKNNKLIRDAVKKIPYFNNTSKLKGCNKGMLAACMAGAYGAYAVVITSNCPGAAVFGPWGVGACLAGASIAYGAAIYTCTDTYCED